MLIYPQVPNLLSWPSQIINEYLWVSQRLLRCRYQHKVVTKTIGNEDDVKHLQYYPNDNNISMNVLQNYVLENVMDDSQLGIIIMLNNQMGDLSHVQLGNTVELNLLLTRPCDGSKAHVSKSTKKDFENMLMKPQVPNLLSWPSQLINEYLWMSQRLLRCRYQHEVVTKTIGNEDDVKHLQYYPNDNNISMNVL